MLFGRKIDNVSWKLSISFVDPHSPNMHLRRLTCLAVTLKHFWVAFAKLQRKSRAHYPDAIHRIYKRISILLIEDIAALKDYHNSTE